MSQRQEKTLDFLKRSGLLIFEEKAGASPRAWTPSLAKAGPESTITPTFSSFPYVLRLKSLCEKQLCTFKYSCQVLLKANQDWVSSKSSLLTRFLWYLVKRTQRSPLDKVSTSGRVLDVGCTVTTKREILRFLLVNYHQFVAASGF